MPARVARRLGHDGAEPSGDSLPEQLQVTTMPPGRARRSARRLSSLYARIGARPQRALALGQRRRIDDHDVERCALRPRARAADRTRWPARRCTCAQPIALGVGARALDRRRRLVERQHRARAAARQRQREAAVVGEGVERLGARRHVGRGARVVLRLIEEAAGLAVGEHVDLEDAAGVVIAARASRLRRAARRAVAAAPRSRAPTSRRAPPPAAPRTRAPPPRRSRPRARPSPAPPSAPRTRPRSDRRPARAARRPRRAPRDRRPRPASCAAAARRPRAPASRRARRRSVTASRAIRRSGKRAPGAHSAVPSIAPRPSTTRTTSPRCLVARHVLAHRPTGGRHAAAPRRAR